MPATRYKRPAPEDMPTLRLRPHDYLRTWEGRSERCQQCPLPRRNRIHDPDAARAQRQAEYRRYEDARMGERDTD